MKKKLMSLALATTMLITSVVPAMAETTKWELENPITLDGTTDTTNAIANPLLNVTDDNIIIEYSMKTTQDGAAWLGLAQFYGIAYSSNTYCTNGVLHFGFWPHIALNDFNGAYFEYATANNAVTEGTIYGDSHNDNENHTYKYVVSKTNADIYVDGEKVVTYLNRPSDSVTSNKLAAAAMYNYLIKAPNFTVGCGSDLAWWAEMNNTTTINSFSLSVASIDAVTSAGAVRENADSSVDLAFVSKIDKTAFEEVKELGVVITDASGVSKICPTRYVTTDANAGADEDNYAFRTIILGVDTAEVYTAVPYIVTADGTTLYGDELAICADDVINAQ